MPCKGPFLKRHPGLVLESSLRLLGSVIVLPLLNAAFLLLVGWRGLVAYVPSDWHRNGWRRARYAALLTLLPGMSAAVVVSSVGTVTTVSLLVGAVLLAFSGPLAVIDIYALRLPDILILLLAANLTLICLWESCPATESLALGALLLSGPLFLGYLVGQVGAGDVKLGAVVGAAVAGSSASALSAFAVLVLALLFLAPVAVGLLVTGRRHRNKVPFGPYLLAAALTVWRTTVRVG